MSLNAVKRAAAKTWQVTLFSAFALAACILLYRTFGCPLKRLLHSNLVTLDPVALDAVCLPQLRPQITETTLKPDGTPSLVLRETVCLTPKDHNTVNSRYNTIGCSEFLI